jgi:hypothetical protein
LESRASVAMDLEPASSQADPTRRRVSRRRSAAGWTASVLLHAGLASLALGAMGLGAAPAGAPSGGDTGDMTVMLVSPKALDLPPMQPVSGRLEPLFANLDTGAPPIERASQPSGDLDRLFQRLQNDDPARTDRAPEDRLLREAASVTASQGRDGDDAGTDDQGKSGGDLWGLIGPCWKSLAQRSAAPVTLEVVVNMKGGVTTPPQIIRGPKTVVDERQLRSEARALSALSTCMGQGDPKFGGRTYRLNFLPPRK